MLCKLSRAFSLFLLIFALGSCSFLDHVDKEFTLKNDKSSQNPRKFSKANFIPLPDVLEHFEDYYTSETYMEDFKEAVLKARKVFKQESQFSVYSKLAIVLDVDETALSNWKWIHETILSNAYSPAKGKTDFITWQKEGAAESLFPTIELYREVSEKGVHIFFVSERPESMREITELNLLKAGYDKKHTLVLRPDAETTPSITHFKSAARQKIEEQGYEIILNMGDQAEDLRGGYAKKKIKVPNPFYEYP